MWQAGLTQYLHEPQEGACLDELYATGERVDGVSIPQAVAGLGEAAGKGFLVGVYYSGIEETFSDGMWYLRDANCIHLEECYWGDENIYRKRWQDITLYRVQARAVLVIAPGFKQSDRVRGSQTAEELVKEFAMVRRVAPDAAGLGVFNAYNRPDLESLADRLIEDYFLKPVIYLQFRQGKLEARNIGHEDAFGYSIRFLNSSGKELRRCHLETLRPWAYQLLRVPSKATSARLNVPDNAVNIYTNGIYEFPKIRDLVQVTETSVTGGASLPCPSGDFTFTVTFSRALRPDSVKPENVFLRGLQSKDHPCTVTYDKKKRSLVARFKDLPPDCYTLRLLSGTTGFLCDRGLPLDGSGNGLVDRPFDHYAVHFKLER